MVIFTYILWWTNLCGLLYGKTSSKRDFINIDFCFSAVFITPIQQRALFHYNGIFFVAFSSVSLSIPFFFLSVVMFPHIQRNNYKNQLN